MPGHIKKRASWQFTVDLGPQPLQRCPACRKRHRTKERGHLERCPRCRGSVGGRPGAAARVSLRSCHQAGSRDRAGEGGRRCRQRHPYRSPQLLMDDFLCDQWLPAAAAGWRGPPRAPHAPRRHRRHRRAQQRLQGVVVLVGVEWGSDACDVLGREKWGNRWALRKIPSNRGPCGHG